MQARQVVKSWVYALRGARKTVLLSLGLWLVLAAAFGASLTSDRDSGVDAVSRGVQGTVRGVLSARDFGAVGDDSRNDAAAIQAAIDSLGRVGGIVYLPAGKYFIGTTGLRITENHVELRGAGSHFAETTTVDAPTLIRYTGTGSAVTLGSPGMRAPITGIVLRDFGIKGTAAGVAGVHGEYNNPASAFVARSLIENVSVQGFVGVHGAGIRWDFGVSNTMRRTNTFLNTNGIQIEGGTTYHLNDVISRINRGQGLLVKFANGLLVDGMSVLEANAGAGLLVSGVDSSRNIFLGPGLHFEDNNLEAGGEGHQLRISGSAAVRARNVVINGVEFASSGGTYPSQIGDAFLDFVEEVDFNHVWSNRSRGNTLGIGTTAKGVRYGPQIITGGTVDPDARGSPYGITEGSFLAKLTGCTTSPTYTVRYLKSGNHVTLQIPRTTGMSNATTKTLAGLPKALTPSSGTRYQIVAVSDNGGAMRSGMISSGAEGAIRFSSTLDLDGFTASGVFSSQPVAFTYLLAAP